MRPHVPALPAGLLAGGRADRWAGLRPAYVALDVDGTLIHDTPVPSQRVLAAVREVTASGILVGLATGRMAAASDAMLATGAFTGPHVFHNGATVVDGEGVERVVEGLDDAAVDAVLAMGRGRDDLAIEVYVGRTYLRDRDDPRVAPHAALLGAGPSGSISTSEDLAGRAAVKAVAVCFTPEAAQYVVEAASGDGLAAGPAASPATPGLRYVNVTRAGVDKGTGVAAAASLLDLDLARVAGIGDETNDLPMLARVGTAVAMGGAGEEVRATAHLVAPTFAEDGVIVALRSLMDLDP